MEIQYYDILRPEDSGKFDFELFLYGKSPALVKAHELMTLIRPVEIIACLVANSRVGFYLYGKDDRLYHHMYNDEILNQYIPLQAFQRFLNSCTLPGHLGTATEERPNDWHYYQCYPCSDYIVIHDSIWKEFLEYKQAYSLNLNNPHTVFYYVGNEFPFFMHNVLGVGR